MASPVVPVFWIDAEDHDWAEVSGCTVLDQELSPRTIRLPDLPGAGERPVARLVLDDDGDAQPSTNSSPRCPTPTSAAEIIGGLRRAYRPGRGMAEAFGCWLETVLGPHGLVVYDSSDPAAKPLARAIFTREIAEPGAHRRTGQPRRRGARGQGLSRAGDAARRRHLALPPRLQPRGHQGDVATRPRSADERPPLAAPRGRGRQPARSTSAPTCCSGRWCRTRSSPPSATWRGRTSSPIWASCARSTPTSASRCR